MRRALGETVFSRARPFSLPTAAVAAALLMTPAEARAQSAGTNTAKGIAAGALLGAEAVLVTEAALGVRPAWAYWVGGVAGAGAGAAGGYFIGDGGSTELTSFLLAGGIACVMPTLIAVVAATTFSPTDSHRVDAPSDADPEPVDGAPAGGEEALADEPATAHFALPSIAVTRAFSAEEISTYGVAQALQLHIALGGSF